MLAIEAGIEGWLIWSGGAPDPRRRAPLARSRLEGKPPSPPACCGCPPLLSPYGAGLLQIQGWLGGLLQMVLGSALPT